MKLPKSVTDRTRDGRGVVTTWKMFAPTIRDGLDELFGPGAGDKGVDFFEVVFGGVSQRVAQLQEAAGKRLKEGLDLPKIRKVRDDLGEAQYRQLIRVRDLCRPVYGDHFVFNLGLGGRIPNDPNGVFALAGYLLDHVDAVARPEADESVSLDLDLLLAPMRELQPRLGDALERMKRETREKDLALAEKDDAQAAHDLVFGTAAGMLSDLLATLGEDALAGKVRPSGRRPGRASGELPVDDTDADAPPPAEAEEAQG